MENCYTINFGNVVNNGNVTVNLNGNNSNSVYIGGLVGYVADGLYVEGCKIIDKPKFGWPNWKEEHLEDVEIIGLCTDICVVSNALIIKATFPDINVKVDSNCCAGVTVETHEAALKTMAMCQIEIV